MFKVVSIVTTAVVAHILTKADFGIFAVASTVYIVVFALGELGVASCLARGDLDIDAIAPTMVLVSWTTSVVQAAVMIAFARPIAAALGQPGAADPIRVLALVLVLVGIFSVPSAQLMREFKQDKIFLAETIAFIASTVVLLLLARSGSGAMAFAWSRLVGQFISGCVVTAAAPKNYWPGISRSVLTLLLRFGLPLSGAGFIGAILLNADYGIIGHYLSAGALGSYVLAFNIASLPGALFGMMVQNVSLPAFSRVKHDAELLKSTIAGALRAISLLVMPISAVVMALARPLVLTVYGSKWPASAEVLSVLALYGSLSIICMLVSTILAGLGRARLLLVVQLLWISILFPAMVIGVHLDGIVGAAAAHVVVILPIMLPTYFIVLEKATGVRFLVLVKAILPAVLAAAAAGLVARSVAAQFIDPVVQLVIGLAAGGLIYVVAAAPQLVALLSHGRIGKLPSAYILRPYAIGARLIGLGHRPKHSVRNVDLTEQEIHSRAGSRAWPKPGEARAIEARLALDLLISLSNSQSAVAPAGTRTPERAADTLQQFRIVG